MITDTTGYKQANRHYVKSDTRQRTSRFIQRGGC